MQVYTEKSRFPKKAKNETTQKNLHKRPKKEVKQEKEKISSYLRRKEYGIKAKKGNRFRRDNTKAMRQNENTEIVDNFLLIDLQKASLE